MATCKYCLGRQEGTQFCWKKNKITNIVNGICPEYEHNFLIAIMASREKPVPKSEEAFCKTDMEFMGHNRPTGSIKYFSGSVDITNLTPKQREHVKIVLRKEVYRAKKDLGGI